MLLTVGCRTCLSIALLTAKGALGTMVGRQPSPQHWWVPRAETLVGKVFAVFLNPTIRKVR